MLSRLIVILLLYSSVVMGQIQSYSFEEIDSLQQVNPKNILVFIHTDWCKYCQSMKHSTFVDDEIIDIVNDSFRFVHFNAEEKKEIVFHGRRFKYKPTGSNTGVHELAEQLGRQNNKLSYPSLCILNTNYEIIFQYDQFISAVELLSVLRAVEEKD